MRRVSSWSLIPVALLALACARNDDAHDELRRDLQLASANLHKQADFPLVETLPPPAPAPKHTAPPASGTPAAQRPQPVSAPVQAPPAAPAHAADMEVPTPVTTPSQTDVAEALPAIPRPAPAPIPAAEPAAGRTRGGGVSGPTVVIGGGTVVIRGGAVGIDDCAAHDARRAGVSRSPPGGIAINSRFPPPVPGLPRPQN